MYLSRAWFDDVNRVAKASAVIGAAGEGSPVTIQQVVTGRPSGDVRYWVRVGGGAVEVGPGEASGADATVTQSYETAVAVSTGRLAVEDALREGRIRIGGDVALLARNQAALIGVGGALSSVHEHTTYEAP